MGQLFNSRPLVRQMFIEYFVYYAQNEVVFGFKPLRRHGVFARVNMFESENQFVLYIS